MSMDRADSPQEAKGASPGARDREQPKTMIRSVQRALGILDVLVQQGDQPLGQIADRLGLSRSTCHHLVSTLLYAGYVNQHPIRKTYSLGHAARALGRPGSEQQDLLSAATSVMNTFFEKFEESVMLVVLRDPDLLVLKTIETPKSVKASYGWGNLSDGLHSTAPGKAISAWLPEETLTRLIGYEGLSQHTPTTITSVAELLDHLRYVRRHRIAYDRDEHVEGLTSLSATVRDSDGAVIAAYSCCLPTLRAEEALLDDIAQELITGAQNLATSLGH